MIGTSTDWKLNMTTTNTLIRDSTLTLALSAVIVVLISSVEGVSPTHRILPDNISSQYPVYRWYTQRPYRFLI